MSFLPAPLRPYAKAIAPAVLAVLAALVRALATGHVASPEVETALAGLVAALVTFLVPNGTAGPAPVPLLTDEQSEALAVARARAAAQDPPTRPAA